MDLKQIFTALILSSSFIFQSQLIAASELPPLIVDSSQITVSGLSSGAFMATQLEVAYSAVFSGAAIFAGGVYGCAEGSLIKAQFDCMAAPDQLNLPRLVESAKTLETLGLIDPLVNLNHHRIYFFSGKEDRTVLPPATDIAAGFYRQLAPAAELSLKTDLSAGHGQPTLNFGIPCGQTSEPWILNCGFDGAGDALRYLFGSLLHSAGLAHSENLHSFSQAQYAAADALMGATGYIYVPKQCEKKRCPLHVSLHGCRQGPDQLGPQLNDAYRMHAGYNEWAESNGIVVLYPSATPSALNPKGCWDWWGYTGESYLTREAPQMRAILKMINALSSPSRCSNCSR